ncbi:death-associated inhibitor of apoptosis 1 [Musca vetustissima]|uniref:death-associated inhibitor of apoptosis 1 n=1 Tax=Musca vetustissima TaxID=27455 RepID=UPI002AB778CD|nr:death-associated inhibitor of apoptosis 1 [Musca vetustissima]
MPGDLATEIRPSQPLFPRPTSGTTTVAAAPTLSISDFITFRLFPTQATAATSLNQDETDNNTHNDFMQIGQLTPRYAMDDRFHREDERLKTFENWPLEFLDRNELARSGMFYMGESDKTKCYFCEVEIGRWEREDQPVPEHLRWSPNCPLLRRRTTNNVPINAELLERTLPAPSYDICGANDIEIRRNAFAEGTIPAPLMADIPPASPMLMAAGVSSSGSGMTPGGTFFPEVPEYAIETARIRSFAEWPRNMKQRPEQLAEAGFFYTGVGDRVKCFSCGGGLKDWDDDDEPWEQHALWMSKCRFVKLMKGDAFIEAVANKLMKKPTSNNSTPAPSSESSSESSLSSSEEEGEPAVRPADKEIQQTNSTATKVAASSIPQPCSNEQQTPAGQTAAFVTSPLEQKRSSTSIPEEKLCKICYANEYNTAFLPCGHVVACAKCASSVTKCPMCRKPFADVMRVYFS